MSLLKEIQKTVVEGNNVIIGNLWNSEILNPENLRGYKVITGYVEPRDESNVLLLDNVTNEPVQVPVNSFPFKTFFVPEIPLVSPDLSSSYLELEFYDDATFNSNYSDWNGYWPAEDINTKCFTEMINVSGDLSEIAGYPYIGFASSGDFTAGKVQIYMYFFPATLPPL